MKMGESSAALPVSIQPKSIYGLRGEVIGNVQFGMKGEVIYPVEAVIAFHDFVEKKQKFLRLPEGTEALNIAMSPSRKLLAIVENEKDKKHFTIAIYDLTTLKKRRTFEMPPHCEKKTLARMAFSFDSRTLIALTNPPDETLIFFLFDKSDTVLIGRAASPNIRGSLAQCIGPHFNDASLVAVGGPNLLKLMMRSDKGVTTTMNFRTDGACFTSLAWISADLLVAGTSKAQLWIIDSGELRTRLNAREADNIDLLSEIEETVVRPTEDSSEADFSETSEKEFASRVLCLTAFAKGLAYAVYNAVYVFEKTSKFKMERKTILRIPMDIYPDSWYLIQNLTINVQMDTVVVTAKHNQIYAGVLIVPESLRTKELKFITLGQPIHSDEIIDVSMCLWRPIIMTASKDFTVRIWNYELETVELVKRYQVDVTVIELNPTGLLAAIGFADQLRVVQVFMDDLRIIKTYNFPRTRCIQFSTQGHLMACGYDNIVSITSVYHLDILLNLTGHNGDILSLAWSKNDKYIITGGNEGAIYQWDVETGERVKEVVQKGIEYRSMVTTAADPFALYAVTSAGTMREIIDGKVSRELTTPSSSPLTCLVLSKSDLIMFMSTEGGHLYNIQLPFLEAGGGTITNYRFYDSAITKLYISHDGTLLITASQRGTLGIWAMQNIEGRVAPLDKDLLKCQEVLIPRQILKEKFATITNLELRLQQQAEEFNYQLTQNEAFDEAQMADIHRGYCQAIEELKQKNNEMEQRHVLELNQITSQTIELRKTFNKDLATLSAQYSERMLMEYQKFTNLRDSLIEMRESYEEKLRISAGSLQDTIEALETDFKKQLRERQELIRKLMQEMEDKKAEFIEYCRQVELDNDRNMCESQLSYEKKLKDEQTATLKWRGDAGVLKRKYETKVHEAEELAHDVENLKEEHLKNKIEIHKLLRTIDDLRKEIDERDYAINDKEKRIQEVMHKNQELEKYKQVLSHKISELKAKIEPRERQIKEKRNQISEMERELEGLHSSNVSLELQLNELRDKYISSVTELKVERKRSRLARNFGTKICGDIYQVAGNINRPDLLREGIKTLFQRYSDDKELKKSILLDAQVQSEFQRQREHVEKLASNCKKKMESGKEVSKAARMLKDNTVLLSSLQDVTKQLEISKKLINNYEAYLGVGGKSNAAARHKLKIIFEDVEKYKEQFKLKTEKFDAIIEKLVDENNLLQREIQKYEERHDEKKVPKATAII